MVRTLKGCHMVTVRLHHLLLQQFDLTTGKIENEEHFHSLSTFYYLQRYIPRAMQGQTDPSASPKRSHEPVSH